MLNGAAVLMPLTVTVFDTRVLPVATAACVTKISGFGSALQASDVSENVRGTPAMVSVVVVVVLQMFDAVARTVISAPGLTTPAAVTKALLPIWYSPPLIEIAVDGAMAANKIEFETRVLESGTFTCVVNADAFISA